MRVAVLWATLTGYVNAELKALAAEPGVSLFVADNVGPTRQAPFGDHLFAWIPPEQRFMHDGNPDPGELRRRVEAFQPDAFFVASWSTSAYNEICKHYRGRAVRVTGMDNQWRGTAKQWFGVLTAPLYVRRLFDCIWVGGERQRLFAERLGFDTDHIWQGFCSPDYEAFKAVRLAPGVARNKRFLFAARLAEEKGLDVLLAAYQSYRQSASEPWELHILGSGAQASLLQGQPGVIAHGFVQPDAIAAVFGVSGCFVLPSVFEPWGVAIQEAAVSGLPIICSEECGARVHYVVDGYNGHVVKTGSVASLARAMTRMAALSDAELAQMSDGSLALSEQMTPTRWARYFLAKAAEAKVGI